MKEIIRYKMSATGAMQVWTIAANLDRQQIYIMYGQLGGALQTQTENVEINKSGRTIREQMVSRVKSRISKQEDKGYRKTVKQAIANKGLNAAGLSKPMLAQRLDKIPHVNFTGACIQKKYNGHRCLITNIDGEYRAYTRNGKPIDSIDHIFDSIKIPEGMTIDGELYHHGSALQTISSWVKKKQENTEKLQYVIYDTISSLHYKDRLDMLMEIEVSDYDKAYIASTQYMSDIVSINDELNDTIDMGYEGLIIRLDGYGYEVGKRSRGLIKVKRCMDDEFKVVDITPSRDGWAVLTCEVGDRTFSVSAPGTMGNKRSILENKHLYIGQKIQVEYFEETLDGIPFHPVATIWRDKDHE